VAIVVVLALVGGAGAYALTRTDPVPAYAVPDLTVGTIDEAEALALQNGWQVVRNDLRRDGTLAGQVLAQDPAAGEELAEGEVLELTVSEGQTLSTVPTDLIGMPVADALVALDGLGLVPEVSSREDEDALEGAVLEVSSAGEELEKGASVEVLISDGPAPRTVPSDLRGLSVEDATAELADAGLGAEVVEERFDDDAAAGLVLNSSPGGGEQVERDSVIGLVVSLGPDLVTVPEVSGSLADAVAALEAAGLSAGSVAGPATGSAFSTDPAPGTEVRRGTSIDIFLRR
jgi:serine/threonine-protein kinase